MNKVLSFGVFLAVAGFVLVAATGIDLAISRTGLGLLLLGLGGFLVAVARFVKPAGQSGLWLSVFTCIGGGYFIWRALFGGPISLAVQDVMLVLVALGTYLVMMVMGRKGRSILLIALAVVCVANVGVAFTQAFGGQAFSVWEANSVRGKAATGFFGHYNPFAGFLNGSTFFFLSYLFLGKRIVVRAFCGVLVVGIFVSLVYSASRGGWVSFVAGGVIWLVVVLTYLKQRESRFFGTVLIASLLVSALGVVSSYWMIQKLTDYRFERDREISTVQSPPVVDDGGRMEFLQIAFEIFQEAPVIGAGPRAYSYLSLSNWDVKERMVRERPPVFAHNEYAQALSDYGLLGLAIIIGLIVAHVVHGVFGAVTQKNERDDLSIWQVGAIGGMTSILCQCFFSFLLHVPACLLLLAVQAGFLGTRNASMTDSTAGDREMAIERFRGAFGIVVSVVLTIFGILLTKAYLLTHEANRQIVEAKDEKSVLEALDTLKSAGDLGRDPKVFEIAARLAMNYANEAAERKSPELAREFNLSAKDAFERGLSYNPHFPAGIIGLPRVEDSLGNWEVAEAGYKKAMEKLWMREYHLRPFYHAAQGARHAAFRELYTGDKSKALVHFRLAQHRLMKRREIFDGTVKEVIEEKQVRLEVEAWIAFLEAGLFFKAGDQVWKNARPRNPELAYALMLEAENRYKASGNHVKNIDPSWTKQFNQVQINIGYLKAGQIIPAKLSEEEIQDVLAPEAGLDSRSTTR